MDDAWAKFHATRPDVKRVDIAVSIRPDLLTGNPSQPGDQVVELTRKDFLKHGGVLIYKRLQLHRGAHPAGRGEQLGRNPLGSDQLGSSDPRTCGSTWQIRCGLAGRSQPR